MASEKQQEHLQKARAARAAKQENNESNITFIESNTKPHLSNSTTSSNYNEQTVWVHALISAMRNLEVKHASNVASCVPIADAALLAYKAKFA